MTKLVNPALLAGRILMSIIFIVAGFGKITAYAGTAGYMAAMGVPGILLLLGFQTQIVAFLLAGFCIVSGLLFHFMAINGADAMADMTNQIMFMKNLAMAGGLLAFLAVGAGALSVDGKLLKA